MSGLVGEGRYFDSSRRTRMRFMPHALGGFLRCWPWKIADQEIEVLTRFTDCAVLDARDVPQAQMINNNTLHLFDYAAAFVLTTQRMVVLYVPGVANVAMRTF